jgi:hypothetical protein
MSPYKYPVFPRMFWLLAALPNLLHALDGNTDSSFFDGSVTATNLDANTGQAKAYPTGFAGSVVFVRTFRTLPIRDIMDLDLRIPLHSASGRPKSGHPYVSR